MSSRNAEQKYKAALEALVSQLMSMRRAMNKKHWAADTLDIMQRRHHMAQACAEVESSVAFLESMLAHLEGGFKHAVRACALPGEHDDELIPRLVGLHSLIPPITSRVRMSDSQSQHDGVNEPDSTGADTTDCVAESIQDCLPFVTMGIMPSESVRTYQSQHYLRSLQRHASTDPEEPGQPASSSSSRAMPY